MKADYVMPFAVKACQADQEIYENALSCATYAELVMTSLKINITLRVYGTIKFRSICLLIDGTLACSISLDYCSKQGYFDMSRIADAKTGATAARWKARPRRDGGRAAGAALPRRRPRRPARLGVRVASRLPAQNFITIYVVVGSALALLRRP
eukprot:5647362-Pleurochrysis_carterae.AAC.2